MPRSRYSPPPSIEFMPTYIDMLIRYFVSTLKKIRGSSFSILSTVWVLRNLRFHILHAYERPSCFRTLPIDSLSPKRPLCLAGQLQRRNLPIFLYLTLLVHRFLSNISRILPSFSFCLTTHSVASLFL